MKKKTVAIQGGYGAFHQIAAIEFFGEEGLEIIPCDTFNDLFESLNDGRAEFGIMAIENNVAGSILPNYKLIKQSNNMIVGEIYLKITQNLMAMPGQTIEDIKEVYSHPMAILQCLEFFKDHPHVKLIESIDTALSAKDIADSKQMGVGAIASSIAAKMYGLEILNEGIQNVKTNQTRFWAFTDKSKSDMYMKLNNLNPDKASICFDLPHQVGSLSQVLSVLAFYGINLTKIQSWPIAGESWSYTFYIDVIFDDYIRYRQSLDAIRPLTRNLYTLGEYPRAEIPGCAED